MLIKVIKQKYRTKSSKTYVKYLKRKGIKIGENCFFRGPNTTEIDLTRPSLISIGNNVDMNRYFTIMTHDYTTSVFLRKYNDFLNSSGKVIIGDNIYFGIGCTVLKGVTIGNNCIIGAHSLVSQNIPDNSVAIGSPAKVICSIDEYYAKRKKAALDEALEYAFNIYEKQNRIPIPSDFQEEFIHFLEGENLYKFPKIKVKKQLQEAYPIWKEKHKATFNNFEDFLSAAGIPIS